MADVRLCLPTMEDLDRLPARALPGFLVELSALQAHAALRLREHDENRQSVAEQAERLLSVKETATMFGMSEDWLYRHHVKLPFTRPLGKRTLRFSEAGIRAWLAHRR